MPFDRSFPAPAPPRAEPGRTLFLSDLHLGALSSRGALILEFLRAHPADTYVLVGDVLDLWQPLLPHWTTADQAVIDYLCQRHAAGARLIYVRGNHDPDPASAPPHARLPARAVARHEYRARDGRRYLVVHGDQADSRMIRTHLMTRLGSRIDHHLRRADRMLRRFSRPRPGARSKLEWLIMAANLVAYARGGHERRLVRMARAEGFDGVICGHFHIARLNDRHGLIYANCGDWVDSLTAIVEADDGGLQLLAWCPEIAASAQKSRTMGLEDAA
jgi:UDP-2,3-diacylglucosamine pyrophosphatase LpxH